MRLILGPRVMTNTVLLTHKISRLYPLHSISSDEWLAHGTQVDLGGAALSRALDTSSDQAVEPRRAP